MSTLARERLLALAVNDAQWAVEPTLGFPGFLARRSEGLPVFLSSRSPRASAAAVAAAGADSLTPSEWPVTSREVMTNREIAEDLFVTIKTIEMHLASAYGRLGIRSWTQFAGMLVGRGAIAEPAGGP